MEYMNQNAIKVMNQMNGLLQSRWNVVFFRDDPWLYLQFYLGIFLDKPTILVVKKSEKYFIKRLRHPLVKHVIEVDNMDKATADAVALQIDGMIGKHATNPPPEQRTKMDDEKPVPPKEEKVEIPDK